MVGVGLVVDDVVVNQVVSIDRQLVAGSSQRQTAPVGIPGVVTSVMSALSVGVEGGRSGLGSIAT